MRVQQPCSKLGYLLSGPLTPATTPLLETSVLYVSIPIEEDTLSHHWEAELTSTDIGTDTSDQDIFDRYLQSHIKREGDSAYCVKFPWKQDHPALLSNYTVCTKKTRSLARKLSQEFNFMIKSSKSKSNETLLRGCLFQILQQMSTTYHTTQLRRRRQQLQSGLFTIAVSVHQGILV